MADQYAVPRLDDWEFYYIKAGDGVNGTEHKLNGVVGGTISWDYDSDTKVSGNLDFYNFYGELGDVLFNAHIRIYYCPTINGKRQKIKLATGYCTQTQGVYKDRLFNGNIEFQGELLRYTDDELPRDWTIAKGTKLLTYYKAFHKNFGNAVYTWENVQDKASTSAKVIEFGSRPMDVLQYVADALGAEIVQDVHGRINIRQYITPDKRPVKYTYGIGDGSLIYGDLQVEETLNGTPNRVVVRHKWSDNNGNEKVLYGVAQIASNVRNSATNQNRWITRTFDESEISPQTQAQVNKVASERLKENSQVEVRYTFNSFYAPFTTGDVIRFRYGKFDVDGIVKNIDMDISAGAPMTVTVKRVRYR